MHFGCLQEKSSKLHVPLLSLVYVMEKGCLSDYYVQCIFTNYEQFFSLLHVPQNNNEDWLNHEQEYIHVFVTTSLENTAVVRPKQTSQCSSCWETYNLIRTIVAIPRIILQIVCSVLHKVLNYNHLSVTIKKGVKYKMLEIWQRQTNQNPYLEYWKWTFLLCQLITLQTILVQ